MTKSKENNIYKDVLDKKQKRALLSLIIFWLILLTFFTIWWFEKRHFITNYGFILNSIIIFWNYFIPAYFFYFVYRMKIVDENLDIPTFRVAMVVTKAPSEPFSILERTLKACLEQKYPHDTWVADEDPNDEAIEWYKKNNIKLSTRKNVAEYHNARWPRRRASKEGNLAYFYDTYGYKLYDIVVQFDIDHMPAENYLEEMVRPFIDEKVGYVSAPSICDQNADKSWSARARLYAEGIMHGPLQAGHTDGFAPLCIGSHYAVRTKALQQIGGLGPEFAEDHSTTLLFNANGWKGAHALNAIARGDGPETFADCMIQEFRWSRSLTVLLLTLTPKVFRKLPIKMKIQFIFSELWYPLFSGIMIVGLSLPLLSIILQKPLVSIPYLSFLLVSIILDISIFAIVIFLKKNKLLRPVNAKIISWEVIIFQLARWPYVIYGITMGIFDAISKSDFKIMITPKGGTAKKEFPMGILSPYIALLIIYLSVLYFSDYTPDISGYYYFSYLILLYYFISIGVILSKHNSENN